MKIAILGDLHFGKHKDSLYLLNQQQKFFENIFFPALEKEKINVIIQLGDVFDKRKQINFYTLFRAKQMFFDELVKRNIKMYTLVGNHDTFFRYDTSLNSIEELLYGYSCVIPIEKPTYLKEFDIDLIPWITRNNEADILTYIENSFATHCFAHLEITHAMISPGVYSTHGISHEIFSKYTQVFSGHYHMQSRYHNIHYLGTPYQLTFMDVNESKGFFIWNTQARNTLTFVENPNKMYIKKVIHSENDFSYDDFKDKYVKLILAEAMTNAQLEKICAKISESSPIDIIIQDFIRNDEFTENEGSTEIKSSLELILDFVDENAQEFEVLEVKKIIYELYQDALLEHEE